MTNPLTEILRPYARSALAAEPAVPDGVLAIDASAPTKEERRFTGEYSTLALKLLMPIPAVHGFSDLFYAQGHATLAPALDRIAREQVQLLSQFNEGGVEAFDPVDISRSRCPHRIKDKLEANEQLIAARICAKDPATLLTGTSMNACFQSHIHHFGEALQLEAEAQGRAVPEKLLKLGEMMEYIMKNAGMRNAARLISFACLAQERDIRDGKKTPDAPFTEGDFSKLPALFIKQGLFESQNVWCTFTNWFQAAAGGATNDNGGRRMSTRDGARLFSLYSSIRESTEPALINIGRKISRDLSVKLEDLQGTVVEHDRDAPRWLFDYKAPRRAECPVRFADLTI